VVEMKTQFKAQRKSSRIKKVVVSLFLLGFPLLVTLCVLRYREAQKWSETTCTIVSYQVSKGRRGYVFDLTYRYSVGWRRYESKRYDLFYDLNTGKAEFGRQHPGGSQVTCYVNPENPQDAVLYRGVGQIPLAIWLFPAIVFLVWAGVLGYLILSLVEKYFIRGRRGRTAYFRGDREARGR
jgi:hypothetical protein